MKTHGLTKSIEYRTWQNMLDRCKSTGKQYKRYSLRGIKVCKRWEKFENFLEDMGERPEGKTLDRIDNNKGYSKSNCRWATRAQQQRNMNSNVRYKGECAMEASVRLGGNPRLVFGRLRLGWSKQRAFSGKVRRKK